MAAALLLLGGATSAFAISGEDENSIQLSGAAFCPGADLDALHVCFRRQGDNAGSCELFEVEASSDVLSSVLCPLRSVLPNPEVVPKTESVEVSTVPIRGMSTGYLRALLPSGTSDPTYAVTQSFPNKSYTVEVGQTTTEGQCSGTAKPTVGTNSTTFCTALANALPRLDVSAGEVVLAIGYRYQDVLIDPDFPETFKSLFGTDQFMTVWACGGRQARCVEGSAAELAVATNAVVLDEIWLRNWLTNSGLRIWR